MTDDRRQDQSIMINPEKALKINKQMINKQKTQIQYKKERQDSRTTPLSDPKVTTNCEHMVYLNGRSDLPITYIFLKPQ